MERAFNSRHVAASRFPEDYFNQRRISGPLLDRIDIHLDVPRIPHEQLSDRRPGECSEAIKERVGRAREIHAQCFAGTVLLTNADMGPKELRQHAALDGATESLLGAAVRQIGLSAHAGVRSIVANPVAKPTDDLGRCWKRWTILGVEMGRLDDAGPEWTGLLRICKQQVRSSSLLVGSQKPT
jgi:hypothetical protein